MSSAKCCSFRLGLNVLRTCLSYMVKTMVADVLAMQVLLQISLKFIPEGPTENTASQHRFM